MTIALHLFPLRRNNGGWTISLDNQRLHDILEQNDDRSILISDLWKLFRQVKKKYHACTATPSVFSGFITDWTPDNVLKQVITLISAETMVDAVLQLNRCPKWLFDKVRKIITKASLNPNLQMIDQDSRLDYLGMFKEFKERVEIYAD